ncbi:MAG: hypothetical protein WEB87_04695 [Bacteriovoracaceae bacterium]
MPTSFVHYLLAFVLILANARATPNFEIEYSGNIELQAQELKNPKSARDLGADWEREEAYIGYANVDAKVLLWKNLVDINWFVRHSASDLYKDDNAAVSYFNFPNNVILRNVFKLQRVEETDTGVTESTLNEFFYEWGDEETSFTFGRMFIDYGKGFVFNPIDPFMLPLSFSSLQGVQQGNDGLKFLFDSESDLRLHLYLLGDKQFHGGDERITRTIFLRGDWDYSRELHINYVLGEDQKRHKYGLELAHDFGSGLLFGQAMRHSQRLDKQDSDADGLFHYIVGYEKDLTRNLTSRLEFGKRDRDEEYPEPAYQQEFAPFSNFLALNSTYNFNPGHQIILQGLLDAKTRFSYMKVAYAFKLSKSLSSRMFAQGVTSRPSDEEDLGQKRVPSAAGIALAGSF